MYLKQVKDVLTLYGGLIILKVIMETKYQNLINYIQEQISDGQLGPGEKVPSENQLSEQFHISRQTVRKAIGTLEEDMCRHADVIPSPAVVFRLFKSMDRLLIVSRIVEFP